jgi:hypothetical protein
VNDGGNFAVLRQIFHSLLLAIWYKEVLKRSIVASLYVDRSITSGMASSVEPTAEAIYQQYLRAYKIGVFNYIREEAIGSESTEIVPRKYFSGGFSGIHTREATSRAASDHLVLESRSGGGSGRLYWVRMKLHEDDDAELGHEQSGGVDTTGGIDLSVRGEFVLSIEREGEGLRFQLPEALSRQLEQTGIGPLRPRVIFVKQVLHNRLEISESFDPSGTLGEISN